MSIQLDDQDKFVKYIQDAIKRKGLDLKAYLATDQKEYVLFDHDEPIYASKSLEEIFIHLDILRISKGTT